MAACFALLAASVALLIRGDVTWRFFNAPERASVSANLAMLPGATRADTLAMVRETQRAVEEVARELEAKHGTNPVTFVLAEVGGTTGQGLANQENKLPEQLGSVAIELIDPDDRPYSSAVFVSAVKGGRTHRCSKPCVQAFPVRTGRRRPGYRPGRGGQPHAQASGGGAQDGGIGRADRSAVEDNLAWDKVEFVLELTAR